MIAYGFLFPRFLDQILALVAEQGGEFITGALVRIGQRLTDAGVIARAEDIFLA